MADANAVITGDQTALNVPADVAQKFADLIELIKGSKSMNQEEKQYWVDVLPIMSEDQLANLRGILDNEKKQLEEANRAYSENLKKESEATTAKFDEETYRQKKNILKQAEAEHEAAETEDEENILAELDQL